jgi:hypothetical protein
VGEHHDRHRRDRHCRDRHRLPEHACITRASKAAELGF